MCERKIPKSNGDMEGVFWCVRYMAMRNKKGSKKATTSSNSSSSIYLTQRAPKGARKSNCCLINNGNWAEKLTEIQFRVSRRNEEIWRNVWLKNIYSYATCYRACMFARDKTWQNCLAKDNKLEDEIFIEKL